jgi:diaminopimelate epimerase
VHLTKHQGLGNDFLVCLVPDLPSGAPELAIRLCERRRGIGADGLIFGLDPEAGSNHRAMVLFNADGSRAEMSGNGIRCLAQAIVERLDAPTVLRIETDAGLRSVSVVPTAEAGMIEAEVDMGVVGPGPDTSRVVLGTGELRCASADLGNPHLVVEVENPTAVDVAVDGPRHEALFASGINVEFIGPVDGGAMEPVDGGAIEMVVWERGAGATEACGSGACAAAHVANMWGIARGRVDVRMPGGTAVVGLGETVTLAGPAVHVADVEVHDV